MKCARHDKEAVAVCAYCGKGLCAECVVPSETRRMACSEECAKALARTDRAVDLLLKKSISGLRVSGFFMIAAGLLFIATGIIAAFFMNDTFLTWHPTVLGVVIVIAGIAFLRVAKRREAEDVRSNSPGPGSNRGE